MGPLPHQIGSKGLYRHHVDAATSYLAKENHCCEHCGIVLALTRRQLPLYLSVH